MQAAPLRTEPQRENATPNVSQPLAAKSQGLPINPEGDRNEIISASRNPKIVPIAPNPLSHDQRSKGGVGQGTDCKDNLRISPPQGFSDATGTEIGTQQPALSKERKHMSAKWIDMTLKRQKQEAPPNGSNGAPVATRSDKVQISPDANGRPRPQGDLQSVEDIYRAAGITNPRMGYSITKVVEMTNSDYIHKLPNGAKRPAVLMALDAAGISLDEVLRDARMRRDALDTYEADQRKTFEEYWARKVEGNNQIQAEMEQVTAEYLARIKRTLDDIAAEKAAFAKWQATKQQEVDRISEAVGLCSRSDAPEPANSPPPLHEVESEVKSS